MKMRLMLPRNVEPEMATNQGPYFMKIHGENSETILKTISKSHLILLLVSKLLELSLLRFDLSLYYLSEEILS